MVSDSIFSYDRGERESGGGEEWVKKVRRGGRRKDTRDQLGYAVGKKSIHRKEEDNNTPGKGRQGDTLTPWLSKTRPGVAWHSCPLFTFQPCLIHLHPCTMPQYTHTHNHMNKESTYYIATTVSVGMGPIDSVYITAC